MSLLPQTRPSSKLSLTMIAASPVSKSLDVTKEASTLSKQEKLSLHVPAQSPLDRSTSLQTLAHGWGQLSAVDVSQLLFK